MFLEQDSWELQVTWRVLLLLFKGVTALYLFLFAWRIAYMCLLFWKIVSHKNNIIPIICRNEFQKLGEDLEVAKGRGDKERYFDILGQLKESFQQCGTVCFVLVSLWCILLYNMYFILEGLTKPIKKIDPTVQSHFLKLESVSLRLLYEWSASLAVFISLPA